ncbi:MAG: hypothetical protein ABJB12_13455 [Pseudomonadota bacterium]
MHPKPDPRFLSVTAHDLRGAVGVLDGALKELSRELPKDSPDATKLCQMMGRSTQRLLLLGDRLSALAKLMDGTDLELNDPSELSALIKESATRAFSAHARRNLQLRLEGGPVSLAVHVQSFGAAICELTALFCSFSQQELVISCSSDEQTVRIEFASDNSGESVRRALRERSATTQANAGIAFAESVVHRHRGTLALPEVENERSKTAVVLVLPR